VKAQTGSSLKRRFTKNSSAQNNAYSQAVITSGGRAVSFADQAAPQKDASAKSLAGDFDGQVRAIFAALPRPSKVRAASYPTSSRSLHLSQTIAMTGDFSRFAKEIFGDNFPASAMINIRCLVQPDLLIEIQSVAVIGWRLSGSKNA